MIKLGILGCANVVRKHIIKAFDDVVQGKIESIASRDFKKAKEWARQFQIEADASYEALLARDDIDAVYIPLPIGLHKEWVIKAAKAKKHIVCEKSLTDNFNDAKKMIQACQENKILLFENFACQYHPQHYKVLAMIAEGAIGDVFLFEGLFGYPLLDKRNIRYKADLGGGSLNDAGTYPLFLSRMILQSEPVAVTSTLIRKDGVDIHGSAYLEFPGKVAQIAFGLNNMYKNNYSVWGSCGMITVERAYTIPADMSPQVYLLKQEGMEKIEVQAANHFSLLFDDFCKRVAAKQDCDYDALLAQARAMEAIRVSAQKDQKVRVETIK